MSKLYVHYGCGLTAPKEWQNFDVSPTLRIQKIPVIGSLLRNKLNTVFPGNVKYGDIVKGIPVKENSCDGIFCSHTLEHLALNDFRTALKNTYRVLKPNGIFRCVLPDLEFWAKEYIRALDNNESNASLQFVGPNTLLGMERRPKGITGMLNTFLGNSHHLWMWDNKSFPEELKKAGFVNIRPCKFNDSSDKMFSYVEASGRFYAAVAFECSK